MLNISNLEPYENGGFSVQESRTLLPKIKNLKRKEIKSQLKQNCHSNSSYFEPAEKLSVPNLSVNK